MSEREVTESNSDLHETTDAQVWAQRFMAIFGERLADVDEDLMISWFANAFFAQEVEDRRKAEERDALAIGWLSAHFAALADAWNGNAPEWFPEPPEWPELWRRAQEVTADARQL